MINRVLLLVSILLITHSAQAEWAIGTALEEYRWVEYPAKFSGTPRECGPRSALLVNWTQESDRGLLLAWRAKIYGGTVNYDTFLIDPPV